MPITSWNTRWKAPSMTVWMSFSSMKDISTSTCVNSG